MTLRDKPEQRRRTAVGLASLKSKRKQSDSTMMNQYAGWFGLTNSEGLHAAQFQWQSAQCWAGVFAGLKYYTHWGWSSWYMYGLNDKAQLAEKADA